MTPARVVTLVVAVCATVACSGGDDDASPIAIFGDSLTYSAAGYLDAASQDADVSVHVRGAPGAALCDLRGDAEALLQSRELSAIVLVFAGNQFTDCIGGLDGDALADAYATDARALAELARERDVPVVLAGPPDMERSPWRENATRLNERMREIAEDLDGVDYLDLRETLSPDGFTLTLECEAGETEAQGCTDGSIRVRDEDGVHFDEPGPDGYSSGARRFGQALFEAGRAVG